MEFIKGMDISTLIEEEDCGAEYFDGGKPADALEILKKYGADYVRLRIWNDPYSESGEPYGAGTNDLERTVELALRAKALNMKILLDLHYSDFWTDPGKQFIPKAWVGYDLQQLKDAVYDYTLTVLQTMKDNGVLPDMVQVGNELSNGMLWPVGQLPAYDNLAGLVSAGIRAVRKVSPEIVVMIHLDNGGNNALYRDWFDHYIERGEDFDVIGMSYYPFWHGTLDDLSRNMEDVAARYHKPIIIAEVSMGFTVESYASYECTDEALKGMATRPEVAARAEYPMTVEGQAAFMKDLMTRIASVPEHMGRGFFYWEPAWIPVPGCGWATEASLKYMNDPGPCGNEWANQALFDYDGNALPALEVIRDFKADKI